MVVGDIWLLCVDWIHCHPVGRSQPSHEHIDQLGVLVLRAQQRAIGGRAACPLAELAALAHLVQPIVVEHIA